MNYILCNRTAIMAQTKHTTGIHSALRQAREAAGMSLADAADHVGVTSASMSRMETGQTQVTVDRMVELARFYGCSPTDLLEGEVTMLPRGADMARVRDIIELVQQVILDLNASPSPGKVADLVMELYKQQGNDLDAHRSLAEMVIRP